MGAIDDRSGELDEIRRRLAELETQSGLGGSGFGGGDGEHPGAGAESVQIGAGSNASDIQSVTYGTNTYAGRSGASFGTNAWSESYGTSLGQDAYSASNGTAIGYGASAGVGSASVGSASSAMHTNSAAIKGVTTADNQIMLGGVLHTVVIPGTFAPPSARRLKEKITAPPELRSIFPAVYEWEYIGGDGRRKIGPMADDLLGTDAERFVTFDDGGRVAGIDYIGLLVAQVAALHARLASLEKNPIVRVLRKLRRRHG